MSWCPEYVLDKRDMWLSCEQKFPLVLSTVSPVHRKLAVGQCGHQKEPRPKGCPVNHPDNAGDRELYCHIKTPDFSKQLSSSISVTFSKNPTEPEPGI